MPLDAPVVKLRTGEAPGHQTGPSRTTAYPRATRKATSRRFANLYKNFAAPMFVRRKRVKSQHPHLDYPGIEDGVRGMKFIEAIVANNAGNGKVYCPMKTLKGPGIFVAQFADDVAPFNSWATICKWAADLGYKGIQIPSWDARFIDLEKVANSQDAADELTGIAAEHGIANHRIKYALYKASSSPFTRPSTRSLMPLPRLRFTAISKARTAWAVDQLTSCRQRLHSASASPPIRPSQAL